MFAAALLCCAFHNPAPAAAPPQIGFPARAGDYVRLDQAGKVQIGGRTPEIGPGLIVLEIFSAERVAALREEAAAAREDLAALEEADPDFRGRAQEQGREVLRRINGRGPNGRGDFGRDFSDDPAFADYARLDALQRPAFAAAGFVRVAAVGGGFLSVRDGDRFVHLPLGRVVFTESADAFAARTGTGDSPAPEPLPAGGGGAGE